MLRREIRKYLYDIAQACGLLESFIAGKSFADYQQNPMLRSAVERQFEIIGEALRQALRFDPELSRHITDCAQIVAFRNRLIHAYANISDNVVWGVLEASLPALRREVQALLDEPERGSPAS